MLGDTIGLSIPTIYAFADGDDAASGGISTTGSDDFNWYSSLAGGATSAGPSFTLIPSSAGSVSVWARLVSQHSGNWIPEDADSIPLSVTVAGVPTPSGLAASSVDSTHAIISWTNGSGIVTAGGRTVVQIEADTSGASWVTVDSTVVTNTADTLSSLAKGMSYNVRIKHIHKGISGSWQTESDLFSTTGGDPVITSFFVASCSTFSTNKVFNDWILGWTKTGSTTGWTWEIYINNVNNPSTASLQTSGTTGTSNSSGTIDDWSQNPTPAYFYFWVRYTNGGSATAFEPLDANPLNVADESCGMAEDRR
ncbi:MAG TPA: fibronectin type III domain-containing protein [Gemmatimonadales bacterium]